MEILSLSCGSVTVSVFLTDITKLLWCFCRDDGSAVALRTIKRVQKGWGQNYESGL